MKIDIKSLVLNLMNFQDEMVQYIFIFKINITILGNPEGRFFDTSCKEVITVNVGEDYTFSTPDYPNSFNNFAVCRWTFKVV